MDEPILAIEGALGVFSVALQARGQVISRVADRSAALERGLALVGEVLSEAQCSLRDVGAIAVGVGPGGFTGLRIAVAFAKSLAFGSGRPLCGVSSFDIVDAAARAEDRYPRLTIVQGRKGVVCIRRTDETPSVACGPIAATLARLWTQADGITIVGATEDVLSAVGERDRSVHIIPAGTEPAAVTVARLARSRAAAASPHAVAPDYGEVPAVKIRT
jgi:tRNA threonylcarbamoyladenosine biosynthesis protein TsaB